MFIGLYAAKFSVSCVFSMQIEYKLAENLYAP